MSLRRSAALREGLAAWRTEGLISDEAVQTLTSRYELDHEVPWYRNSSFMIGLVASALVTMGLILFISENWHHLSIPLRMLTGIIPWLVAAVLTIRATNSKPRAAEAWGFLTSLLFGVNIFLQAQIFHLGGYWPTALMWWAAGSLVVGIVMTSPSIIALAQVIAVLWIGSETEFDNHSPLILAGTAVVAAATVRMITRSTATGLIAMLCWALYHVWGALHLHGEGAEVIPLWSVLGLLAIALYQWAEPISQSFRNIMSVLLGGWIVILALIVSYVDTASRAWLSHGDWFTTALFVAASTLLLVVRRDWWTLGITAITMWLVIGSLFSVEPWVQVFTNGLNLILFGVAVSLMWSGLSSGRKADFMTALLLVIVLAMVRFMDYFDNFLIGAAVFVVAGILLLFTNTIWNRRYAAH